jgi:hypothetical protein
LSQNHQICHPTSVSLTLNEWYWLEAKLTGPLDVCSFFFRDSPQYEPPADLQAFLASGLLPFYIGFGSIVLEDPERITATIINAVIAAGVRATVSKGWSNLGGTNNNNFYFIGDCPHEWLFQHVVKFSKGDSCSLIWKI